MTNEKSKISLNNKRIFLVKVQAIIFLVGMAFAVYFGGLEFIKSLNYSKIDIVDILVGALFGALVEDTFRKIYVLFLSIIILCKMFYFADSGNKKQLFLTYIFSIFILYIASMNKNNLIFAYILYFISIFIYIIFVHKIKKNYKILNEIKLYKAFIFIVLPTISIFLLCGIDLIQITNFSDEVQNNGIFRMFYVFFLLGFFIIYLPLSIWLSIPINLIKEYRYFKKELNISK